GHRNSLSACGTRRHGEKGRGAGAHHGLFREEDCGCEGAVRRSRVVRCGDAADHEGAAGWLRGSYSTLTRNKPRAGAVGPGGTLLLKCRSRSMMFPFPASSNTPTMLRTMCFKKPLPRTR